MQYKVEVLKQQMIDQQLTSNDNKKELMSHHDEIEKLIGQSMTSDSQAQLQELKLELEELKKSDAQLTQVNNQLIENSDKL